MAPSCGAHVSFQSATLLDGVLYLYQPYAAIVALRASDGHLLWKQGPLPAGAYFAGLGERQLYEYSTTTHLFTALDLRDGSRLWDVPMTDFSGALVLNGLVYLGTTDGSLSVRHASDGSLAWQYPGSPSAIPVILGGGAGVVYLTTTSETLQYTHVLTALATSDGHLLWQMPLPAGLPTPETLIIGQGVLYLAASGITQALRISDGHVLWQYPTDVPARGPLTFGSLGMLLADGILYLGLVSNVSGHAGSVTFQGRFLALRASDGTVLWGHRGGGLVQPAGDTVYLLSDAAVEALRASDGTLQWQHPLHQSLQVLQVDHPLLLVQGLLYIGMGGIDGRCEPTENSWLEQVRASDGTGGWHVEEQAVSSPAP